MAKSYALFKKQQKLIQKQRKEAKLKAKHDQYKLLRTSSCTSINSNDSITYDNVSMEQCESDQSSLDEIEMSSPSFETNSYFTHMTTEHSHEYQAFLEFINSSDNSMLHEDNSFNDDFFRDDDFNTISMEDIFDTITSDMMVLEDSQNMELQKLSSTFYESETDTSEEDLEKSLDSDSCTIISSFENGNEIEQGAEITTEERYKEYYSADQEKEDDDGSETESDSESSDSDYSSEDEEDSFAFSGILYYNNEITLSLVPPGIFTPKKNLIPKKSSLRTIDKETDYSALYDSKLLSKLNSPEATKTDILETKMAKHDIIYLMSAKNGTVKDATRYATELNSDNCVGVKFPKKLNGRIYIPTNQSRRNKSNDKLNKAAVIEAKKVYRFNSSQQEETVSESSKQQHLGVYTSDQLDSYLKHNGRTSSEEKIALNSNPFCKKSVKWAEILEW